MKRGESEELERHVEDREALAQAWRLVWGSTYMLSEAWSV